MNHAGRRRNGYVYISAFESDYGNPEDAGSLEGVSKELRKEIERLDEAFEVSADRLKAISRRFEEELEEGDFLIMHDFPLVSGLKCTRSSGEWSQHSE